MAFSRGERKAAPISSVSLYQLDPSLRAFDEREHPPEPVSHAGHTRRLRGGNWEECLLSLFANNRGELTMTGGSLHFDAGTPIEVPWVYEEKGGKKYHFYLTDSNDNTEQFQVVNQNELENWLKAFESHGCKINRPIKTGALVIKKERRGFKPKIRAGWGALYLNGLNFYDLITDSKPSVVVTIGQGSVIDGLTNGFYCLRNEYSQSIKFQEEPWYQAVLAVVTKMFKKKYAASLHEGYLLKNGQGSVAWKRRYFVLMHDHIKYFKHRHDNNPVGTIALPPGADAEGVPDTDESAQKFQFWVAENGDATVRRYKLAAHYEAEKEQWLYRLQTLFATKNTRVASESIREGYLYKRGMTGGWAKRYAVLLPTAFYDAARRHDFVDKSKFDLKKDLVDFGDISMLDLRDGPELLPVAAPDMFALAENGDVGTIACTFRAPDDATKRAWVSDLRTVLKQNDMFVYQHSLHEGYLRTPIGIAKKWTKGYFALTEGMLCFFRARRDTLPTAQIPITASTDLTQFGDSDNPWQFALEGDDENAKFVIAAESEEERSVWFSILSATIKGQNLNVFADSIFEGYMWKPHGRGGFRKRYFVLKPRVLYYYQRRGDSVESGSIEIIGGCEIVIIDDGPLPFMFSVARSGDEDEKVITMRCRDKTSRAEWVAHLNAQIDLCPVVQEVPNSIRECYVYIRRDGAWKKRFCILDQDSISFCPKRSEPQKPDFVVRLNTTTSAAMFDEATPEGVWGRLDTTMYCAPPDMTSWRELDIQAALALDATMEPQDFAGYGFKREEANEQAKNYGDPQMVICNNGDKEAKNVRLRGVDEGFVADVIECCIRKEFPQLDREILKSEDLMASHTTIEFDSWRPSYVVLKNNFLSVYKTRSDEAPSLTIATNANSKFYTDQQGGMHLEDEHHNTVVLKTQREDEQDSWSSAIMECLTGSPRRITLFGGDLKRSFLISPFFRLPYVITLCVEFLKMKASRACSMRHPGFHPIIRSMIQDFQIGAPMKLTHPESVATCLKLYLKMLPQPLISDQVTSMLANFLEHSCEVAGMQKILTKLDPSGSNHNATALSVVLYYLHGEIERGVVSFDEMIAWGPLLMRGNPTHQIAILSMLIHNVARFFPCRPVPVFRLPVQKFKRVKQAYVNTRFDDFRKSKHGMSLFTQFVKDNYVAENTMFLSALQQYRTICETKTTTLEERFQTAMCICDTFIRPGVQNQLNISSVLAMNTLAFFCGTDPPQELKGDEFAFVESEVNMLIVTNEFCRFRVSELFDEWITFRYLCKSGPVTQETGGNTTEEADPAASLFLNSGLTDHGTSSFVGPSHDFFIPFSDSTNSSTNSSPASSPSTSPTFGPSNSSPRSSAAIFATSFTSTSTLSSSMLTASNTSFWSVSPSLPRQHSENSRTKLSDPPLFDLDGLESEATSRVR